MGRLFPSATSSQVPTAFSRFVAGMDEVAFGEDEKTVSAVERELQKISEAAIRLGKDAEMLCPGPAWKQIRGMGNWLRHGYDKVDIEIVWTTVERDIPALEIAVQRALEVARFEEQS